MKTTLTTLRHASLVIIALIALSACGQKGPLVLEKAPIDASQAPLENSTDQIPVETPAETDSKKTSESE